MRATPPGLLYSPLVQGLASLIPLLLVIVILGGSLASLSAGDFQSQAMVISANSPQLTSLSLAAAGAGDFDLAQKLFDQAKNKDQTKILGASTYFERLIFPRRYLEKEIDTLSALASIEPSRLVYLRLSLLNWQLSRPTQAKQYLQLAQNIDPNDPSLISIENLLAH